MLLAALSLLACADSGTQRHARPGRPGDDSATVDTADTADTGTHDTAGPWSADDDTVQPLYGIDVSHWQGTVDWERVAADGITFEITKATQGDYYVDPTAAVNTAGAEAVGMFHGAYHFAEPDISSGEAQASWFVENGGDWYPDGWTLPGVLDIEYNPSGDTCYDLSKSEMADWVIAFSDTYVTLTGRAPIIYTNADWWNTCVGNSSVPDANELWVAYWGSSANPTLPSDWSDYALWQYSSEGDVDGVDGNVDADRFPGTLHDLRMLANDTR